MPSPSSPSSDSRPSFPVAALPADPAAWPAALGISREAVALYRESEVIDLHVDTFIWHRIFGYDLAKRHGRGPTRARFLGQVDLPRVREARIAGATWSITTQPFRSPDARLRAFRENLPKLLGIFAGVPGDVAVVRTARDYDAARAAGKHAAWIGIQGGNAVEADPSALDLADRAVSRVTLVHLTASGIGGTSAPSLGRRSGRASGGAAGDGLTLFGKDFVRELNARRIFVDLAHIGRAAFFDAVEAHDRTQPLIATHTGVVGAHPHWRNLDDEQLRAIAATGGVVGVIYQSSFLEKSVFNARAESIVRHLEHIVATVGEDHAALGSDWDGMIVPPRDLQTCLELPRLVQIMLDRGWRPERVRKVLGGNFLRAFRVLRP